MDEPQTHHPKWKEADAKDYILYDFISIKSLEKHIHRDRKQISAHLGLGVGVGINCKWEQEKCMSAMYF